MSSSHAFAAPIYHPVGDKTLAFHPLTNKQTYSLPAWAKGRIKTEGRQQFPDVKDFIAWCAHVESLSDYSDQVTHRIYSPDGFVHVLWLAAHNGDVTITLEQMEEYFYSEPLSLIKVAVKLLQDDATDDEQPSKEGGSDSGTPPP